MTRQSFVTHNEAKVFLNVFYAYGQYSFGGPLEITEYFKVQLDESAFEIWKVWNSSEALKWAALFDSTPFSKTRNRIIFSETIHLSDIILKNTSSKVQAFKIKLDWWYQRPNYKNIDVPSPIHEPNWVWKEAMKLQMSENLWKILTLLCGSYLELRTNWTHWRLHDIHVK